MGDISLRKTGVKEKRTKAQKESNVLLDYTRRAISRLTYLKRTLAQLEDDACQCEEHVEHWKNNLALMLGKEKQYNQETVRFKLMVRPSPKHYLQGRLFHADNQTMGKLSSLNVSKTTSFKKTMDNVIAYNPLYAIMFVFSPAQG
ncbi:hypothetical protein ACFX13_009063 [Malus domestica]